MCPCSRNKGPFQSEHQQTVTHVLCQTEPCQKTANLFTSAFSAATDGGPRPQQDTRTQHGHRLFATSSQLGPLSFAKKPEHGKGSGAYLELDFTAKEEHRTPRVSRRWSGTQCCCPRDTYDLCQTWVTWPRWQPAPDQRSPGISSMDFHYRSVQSSISKRNAGVRLLQGPMRVKTMATHESGDRGR